MIRGLTRQRSAWPTPSAPLTMTLECDWWNNQWHNSLSFQSIVSPIRVWERSISLNWRPMSCVTAQLSFAKCPQQLSAMLMFNIDRVEDEILKSDWNDIFHETGFMTVNAVSERWQIRVRLFCKTHKIDLEGFLCNQKGLERRVIIGKKKWRWKQIKRNQLMFGNRK
jgi:hypothetical protein